MGQRPKRIQEDLTTWILSLEEHIQKPIVVTLLVEAGKVKFLFARDKNDYLDKEIEPDDGEPEINPKDIPIKAMQIEDYIG